MDTYIVLFLAAVVALYVPVLGWCYWQRRREDASDPYAADWLTYEDASRRLRISAEAVRQRAIRGRYPRLLAKNGRAVVLVPRQELADPHQDPSNWGRH